jgi:hypothetical protein
LKYRARQRSRKTERGRELENGEAFKESEPQRAEEHRSGHGAGGPGKAVTRRNAE